VHQLLLLLILAALIAAAAAYSSSPLSHPFVVFTWLDKTDIRGIEVEVEMEVEVAAWAGMEWDGMVPLIKRPRQGTDGKSRVAILIII
jgi:hypothetical protein